MMYQKKKKKKMERGGKGRKGKEKTRVKIPVAHIGCMNIVRFVFISTDLNLSPINCIAVS
jgi:hypothetical protein